MTPPGARAARIGVALLVLAVVAVSVAHVLRSDVSVRTDRLSELALGSNRGFMIAAFVLVGAGLCAVGLAVAWAGGRFSLATAALLVVGGTGMVVAGIWATDLEGPESIDGKVHSAASAAATVAVIAAAVIHSVLFPPARPPARLEAGLALAGVLLGVLGPPLHRSAVTGYSQRLLWFVLVAWAAVVGLRLATRRPEGESAPCEPHRYEGTRW